MTSLAGLGAVIVALTWGDLALHVPGSDSVGSLQRTEVFVAILAVAALAYLFAVQRVIRRPPRGGGALLWVALVAAAIRLPLLPAPPFLSSDMYRYVWDGRVQAAGINPYRYVPADPALASLRDSAIYPHVNRRDYAPTIYPPAAQWVFASVARLSPSVLAMKAAMLTCETIGMVCVLFLLRRAGLPAARLLIYAWNPLAAWSFAGNGHVDAIVVGFLGLALLARAANRSAWAGAALAGAILAKFLPLAVGPALWRRNDWRLPAALLIVLVLFYVPYLGVGWKVFGFLSGYGTEEGVTNGQGFWLLAGIGELVPLTHAAALLYMSAAALALGALALWLALRPRPRDPKLDARRVCADAGILAACTVAAVSPHYPWYFVWLAVPAAVQPYRAIVWLSVAPLALYLNPMDERFFWPSLVFVPAIALAILDLRGRMVQTAAPASLVPERIG